MARHMVQRPVFLDTELTAEEFVSFITEEAKIEAAFTQEHGEPKTLAQYLADLETRVQRLQDPDDELWVE